MGLHIALANQWYPPESGWGGVAMWNHALARTLVQQGHTVTVLAVRPSAAVPAEALRAGVRVQRALVRDFSRWQRLVVLGRYVRFAQQLSYAWQVHQRLRALHAQQPLDVVEFAEVNAEGYFYARQPQCAVVVRCHTPNFVLRHYYTPQEAPFDTTLIGHCEKSLIRRAHARTAPSQDLASRIETECQLPVGQVQVIPNALLPEDFPAPAAPPEENLVLHVGRLERVKGVEVLAAAIPLVLAQVPQARFVFVGADRPNAQGGSQRAALEAQLAAVNAQAQVQFVGAVDQPTLLQWYARAALCVVPSLLYESFSYTCAQAMLLGKPLIATRIGSIPETVGDCGLLVAPGNVEQLAAALIRLLQAAPLRQQLGQCGYAQARQAFAAPHITQQVLQVYDHAHQTCNRVALSR